MAKEIKEININNLPELLSITEACQVLGVHPNTLRNWDKEGRLKPIRIGKRGDRRYKKADILRLVGKGLAGTKVFEEEFEGEGVLYGIFSKIGYFLSAILSGKFLIRLLWLLVIGLFIYTMIILFS